MQSRRLLSKRLLDLMLTVPGLLVALPAIGLFYCVARLDTRASGFFVQERIGRDGRPFRLLKVRTMRTGPAHESSTTTFDDPRVTPVGRWLRKLKLDELPQLLNVLSGSMSLVGPRPTVREDYDRMTQEQRGRYRVPPGLTGLAQISGNTALSWPERIRYDLEYVENASVLLDLSILLKTFAMIMTGRIETHPAGQDEWRDM